MSTPEQRMKIARAILDFEARRDPKTHHIAVYWLPPGDNGGTYEVAGINDRYHPDQASALAQLIAEGKFEQAEEQAAEYIATVTDHVLLWTSNVALECYLRDCSFNRGPRGSARILQRALGVNDDGFVGAQTKAAIAARETDPPRLLADLRRTREQYERDIAKRDENSPFWKGLVSRWNKALMLAQEFLPAQANLGISSAALVAANFYESVIKQDARFKSSKRVADPALLEPQTRAAVQAIIADAAVMGLNLVIFETFRSNERQQLLFDQGASKLRKVGVHHYGLACDLVKSIDGEPSWKGSFAFLGDLARHHGLIWGGDWGQANTKHTFLDDDHVQRCTLGRQAALFAESWYPDAVYSPYSDGAV